MTATGREPVAILGIGAMGHGMAASALRAGCEIDRHVLRRERALDVRAPMFGTSGASPAYWLVLGFADEVVDGRGSAR